MDQAEQALTIAREADDPALLARALTVCGLIAGYSYNAETAGPYFAEAIGLARALDDRWRLSQILTWQAIAAATSGDPITARAAGEEGRQLADAIGDRFSSGQCRLNIVFAQLEQGDPAGAVPQFGELIAEAGAAHDEVLKLSSLVGLGHAHAYQGELSAARAAAEAALDAGRELGGYFEGLGLWVLAIAALAGGDVETAHDASEAAWKHLGAVQSHFAAWQRALTATEVALAHRDLATARRWSDDAVSAATGWHLVAALTARARVAIAQGEPEQAHHDLDDALTCAAECEVQLGIPDILECLAAVAGDAGSHHEAARLFGAAEAIRQRIGLVRFQIHQAGYEASVAALGNALGEKDFDSALAEGAALSTKDAIAYAQRGRGERKRPAGGWASLTPAERDVVRLVSEGLANKDIVTRLFVSPRTVQAHLTHVYTKLGLTSRVQLAQEAARHA
jgi:DNA-binding CsgD family transcriptional regulator